MTHLPPVVTHLLIYAALQGIELKLYGGALRDYLVHGLLPGASGDIDLYTFKPEAKQAEVENVVRTFFKQWEAQGQSCNVNTPRGSSYLQVETDKLKLDISQFDPSDLCNDAKPSRKQLDAAHVHKHTDVTLNGFRGRLNLHDYYNAEQLQDFRRELHTSDNKINFKYLQSIAVELQHSGVNLIIYDPARCAFDALKKRDITLVDPSEPTSPAALVEALRATRLEFTLAQQDFERSKATKQHNTKVFAHHTEQKARDKSAQVLTSVQQAKLHTELKKWGRVPGGLVWLYQQGLFQAIMPGFFQQLQQPRYKETQLLFTVVMVMLAKLCPTQPEPLGSALANFVGAMAYDDIDNPTRLNLAFDKIHAAVGRIQVDPTVLNSLFTQLKQLGHQFRVLDSKQDAEIKSLTKQVKRLIAENKTLRDISHQSGWASPAELALLKGKWKKQQDENERARFQSLLARIKSLTEELKTQTQAFDCLQNKVGRLERISTQIESRVEQIKSERDTAQLDLQDSCKQVDKLGSANKKLERRIGELKKQITIKEQTLQDQSKQLESAQRGYEIELAQLKKQLSQLQKASESKKSALEAAKTAKEKAVEKMAQLEAELRKLREDYQQQIQSLAKTKEKNKGLERQVDSLKSKSNKSQTKNIEGLERKLGKKQKECKSLASKIQSLKKVLQQTQAGTGKVKALNATLEAKNNTLEESKGQLRQALATMKASRAEPRVIGQAAYQRQQRCIKLQWALIAGLCVGWFLYACNRGGVEVAENNFDEANKQTDDTSNNGLYEVGCEYLRLLEQGIWKLVEYMKDDEITWCLNNGTPDELKSMASPQDWSWLRQACNRLLPLRDAFFHANKTLPGAGYSECAFRPTQ